MVRREAALACGLFATLGFLGGLFTFYPGFMSEDSVDQYAQAVSTHYIDHHPVAMSLVWHTVAKVQPGPYPMLLIQQSALWGGLVVIASWLLKRRNAGAAILVTLVGFLPPVAGLSGVIWKDMQMAVFLLLSYAIVLHANDAVSPRARVRILTFASLVLLAYAGATRHNALAAWVFLLPAYAPALLRSLNGAAGWSLKWRALVSVAIILFVQAVFHISERIANARKSHIIQFVELYDLAGASLRAGVPLYPDWVRRSPDFSTQKVSRFYNRAYGSPLFVDYHPGTGAFRLTGDRRELRSLQRAWIQAWIHHPRAMVGHKLACFQSLLMPSPREPRPDLFWGIERNPFGLQYRPTPSALWVMPALFRIHRTLLFLPIFWLGLSCVGAFWSAWRAWATGASRLHHEALGLFLSAIGYLCSYALFYAANDFRYAYWPAIAASVGWVFLIGSLNDSAPATPRAPP